MWKTKYILSAPKVASQWISILCLLICYGPPAVWATNNTTIPAPTAVVSSSTVLSPVVSTSAVLPTVVSTSAVLPTVVSSSASLRLVVSSSISPSTTVSMMATVTPQTNTSQQSGTTPCNAATTMINSHIDITVILGLACSIYMLTYICI